MRYLLASLICISIFDLSACVVVNQQNNTYVVDQSGCFED